MSATGIKWFTMAFILSVRRLQPGLGRQPSAAPAAPTSQRINAIRAAGGDIVPSIGGWSGNKLGPNCSTPEALAGAYQQVINAYNLKAIDIDIENSDEFENEVVQDRILNALKIVKQNNPGIQTILTFGTSHDRPELLGQPADQAVRGARREHRRLHDHAVRLRRRATCTPTRSTRPRA